MDNLTPLFEREGRWYKIGPITIARGIPKRMPIAFLGTLGIMKLLVEIPSPFRLIHQIDNGWVINYAFIPAIIAAIFSLAKIKGKKPERYLLTMLRYRLMPKRVTPYRKLEVTRVQFGTAFTIRAKEGGTGESQSGVPDPPHRGKHRLQHG